MCGRFAVDIAEEEILSVVDTIQKQQGSLLSLEKREIFPTDFAPVLVKKDGYVTAQAMIWGFPKIDGKDVEFNARAETAMSKSIFRKALHDHPVAVPTTGFFEWKAVPGQTQRQKFLFKDPDADVLYLAGFYNTFHEKGSIPEHFTILTTAANESMAPYHFRMPVLLKRQEVEA